MTTIAEPRHTVEELRAEYRPSMDPEVLHSWAQELVAALTDQKNTVDTILNDALDRAKHLETNPVQDPNAARRGEGIAFGLREVVLEIRNAA